jgi:transcriptional regulator with XRE-family HTH domain
VAPRDGAPRPDLDALPTDLFAKNLRRAREAQGVSQSELALRMEPYLGSSIGHTAILRIEQRTRAVRLDEAVAAAKALDLPLAALISEDPVRQNEEKIQEYLAELAIAERQWEQTRYEVERLTRTIQQLSAERKQLLTRSPLEDPGDADD